MVTISASDSGVPCLFQGREQCLGRLWKDARFGEYFLCHLRVVDVRAQIAGPQKVSHLIRPRQRATRSNPAGLRENTHRSPCAQVSFSIYGFCTKKEQRVEGWDTSDAPHIANSL